jgi:uncharacterized membrane protein (UPF0127 family)
MRRFALAIALLAGCNGSKPAPAPPTPTAGAEVQLKKHKVQIEHLVSDPARRYPPGPGTLCSWDRDRHLHFFSADSPEVRDVVFLDSAGRVIEMEKLAAYSSVGVTSRTEARHALFLSAGSLEKDGLKVGDTVGFSAAISEAKIAPMPVIKVGGHAVHVETSHTIDQRQRGLMHRPRMSKDDGMLFLYPRADEGRGFWMQNTLIALDIAYFDGDGTLVNVARMKPHPDPTQGGDLKAPAAGASRYVLEVNYGWFDARKLIDEDGKPKVPVKLEIPDSVKKLADDAE